LLLDKRKDSWPLQIKSILDNCGLSGWWNNGIEPGVETGLITKAVKKVLKDQEIRFGKKTKFRHNPLEYIEKSKKPGEKKYISPGATKAHLVYF
jgi:hypothetical protein